MTPEDKIKQLEAEVHRLKEREKQLEHNMQIFKQIFTHLNSEFEKLKKEHDHKMNK